ncbi:MAG: ATP-dependent sacrificial sulfur transferase LarE [Selenomonadaceae bacterium]|nr:ATP-dependent sacrificial sulfur transferase LarE [Selenomonadaceae bacterium]
MTIEEKFDNLKKILRSYGNIAIAFSSGVDSTFLLKVAHDELGEKVIAITAVSEFFPSRETEEAEDFCKRENVRQIFLHENILSVENIENNPVDRCYICKKNLFKKILKTAAENKIFVVAEGSNMDDCSDYRPGLKAIDELKIKSPLREAELYKNEIRELSKKLNLPTWEKPSFACLASRFVYGEKITPEKLLRVEKAEEFLREKNFKQFRVRIHENLARIEILPNDFEKILPIREDLVKSFKSFGFDFVSLDLQGYRTGSMNIF